MIELGIGIGFMIGLICLMYLVGVLVDKDYPMQAGISLVLVTGGCLVAAYAIGKIILRLL